MTICTTAFGSRQVVIARPDGSDPGRLSVDMLSAFAQARRQGAEAFLLPPAPPTSEALFAVRADDVARVDPGGVSRAWLVARWRLAHARARMRTYRTSAAASFWLEMHRELRRYIGDDRLPYPVRTRLRRVADVAFRNAAAAERHRAAPRFSRAALRDAAPIVLTPAVIASAHEQARRLGIDLEAPTVVVDGTVPSHLLRDGIELLAARGYRIVRLGDDVPVEPATDSLRLCVLLKSAFVLCGSPALQRTAWLTNTPSLLVNARDPFTVYPVRRNGIFTLATAIDLDTGRTLEMTERLAPSFFQNLRNYGFRHHGAAVLTAALQEMMDGLRDGWRDTAAQARFRNLVSAAGAVISDDVAELAEHDVASGFIGDGRLAAAQADRV